jgi:hypothetical protein
MSVRLQESTVFQFHSIRTRLLIRANFYFGHIFLSKLLTEILHGEVASFGSEVEFISCVNVFVKQIITFCNATRLMKSFFSKRDDDANSSGMVVWLFGMYPPSGIDAKPKMVPGQ